MRAEATQRKHPPIVTAYDADEAVGKHFLVMDYIEGTDLKTLVKAKGPVKAGQSRGSAGIGPGCR